MMGFYDRNGEPIDLETFARLANDETYRRIAWTEFEDVGKRISTIWLGINSNYNPNTPPLIYETIILPDCLIVGRVATEAEALETHDKAVEAIMAAIARKELPG